MLNLKFAKYLLLSGTAGFVVSYSAHTYVAIEGIAASRLSATISGLQSDLARTWGYEPASPTRPSDPDDLPITELLNDAALKEGVNPSLLRAMAKVESGKAMREDARSPVGAIGVLQVMPANAKPRCGISPPTRLYRPSINVMCGARIMRQELNTYKGDVVSALLAYNGGEKCRRSRQCKESEQYVIKVLATLGSEIPPTID